MCRPQPLRLENGEWKPFNVPNGLGLMKQFPLQPGNQADLQKALEQLREQLENMPNIQPGQLPKGFNFQSGFPGGQCFQIPPMPEDVPGKRGFNANIASSVTIADNTGRYTLKTNNENFSPPRTRMAMNCSTDRWTMRNSAMPSTAT